MRKAKASNLSIERQNWEKIFNGMVNMLRSQQQQLLSLASERKLLEDRIRMLHEGWESDIRLYKDQISEMKGVSIFEEKRRLLDGAKAELLLGLKQREVSILNYLLEHQEDELADFKAWFEFLSRQLSDAEDQGKICQDTGKRKKGTTDSESKSLRRKSVRNMAQAENCSNELEAELKRLKREYEIALGTNSKASALLTEKEFVWNQYKIMENEYMNKLRSKHRELELANEKIEKLVSSMEQLHSAKDETISELESKVGTMEDERKSLNGKLSKLSEELEALRKSSNTQVTPILNPCTARTKGSGLRCNTGKSSSRFKRELSVPKAADPATSCGKVNRSSKRKRGPVIPDSATPKLFSSDFKIPKLKILSPNIR
ncbi:uncharacterized protein LOC129318014 [Prosopis cineraria]|uniref:uncharacterized protein LOC129318014 n=1 Tax=Prosopis cineraria TaxID=364024 RepID=UPI00240EB66A|nr:uncharacterized protein LOC129318014 [Prosopis cineraria]